MNLLAMTSDPGVWILFAGMVGGCVGFFACALFASRRIREERRQNWREGYSACNRDHQYGEGVCNPSVPEKSRSSAKGF